MAGGSGGARGDAGPDTQDLADGDSGCLASRCLCGALEEAHRNDGAPDPACAGVADPYIAAINSCTGCGSAEVSLVIGNRGGQPSGALIATFKRIRETSTFSGSMAVADSIAPGALAVVQLPNEWTETLEVTLMAQDGADCVAANDVASVQVAVGLCPLP